MEIDLQSSDGVTFRVNRDILEHSGMLANHFETDRKESAAAVPLPDVSAKELEVIVEWFEEKNDAKKYEVVRKLSDNLPLLQGVAQAAVHMQMKGLTNDVSKCFVHMINSMSTVQEISETLDVTNNLTVEEREEAKREGTDFLLAMKEM